MDFSVTEEARELYNNDPAKVRSEQMSENSTSKPGPQGMPGATSNTPPPAQAANAAAAPAAQRADRAGRHRKLQQPDPQLRAGPHPAAHPPAGRPHARVSVAVLVDNVPRAGANGKVTRSRCRLPN
jgi:flagellar M-ring protein FliF